MKMHAFDISHFERSLEILQTKKLGIQDHNIWHVYII